MALKGALLAYVRLLGLGVIATGAYMGLEGYLLVAVGMAVIGLAMTGFGPALVEGYREGREPEPTTD